jgi:formate hydrogenlyase subunit 4
MNALIALCAEALHIALIVAVAPILTTIIRMFEARLVGRTGPNLLDAWQELLRLARKQRVVAENASPLHSLAPAACFAIVGLAALLVPSFTLGMAFAPFADLLLIVGLLALARCVQALAAMDSGVSIGGISASRTMEVAVLAEPALLLVTFTLALFAGSSSIEVIAAMQREGNAISWASLVLALAAIVLVGLADTRRKGLAQEFSGCDLALLDAANMLRLIVWLNLIGALFLPFGMAPASAPLAWPLGLGCWLVRMLLLTMALVAVETAMGRLRLVRVTRLLACAVLLALLAAVFLFGGVRIA